MTKGNGEFETPLHIPAHEISDSTAAIKARRLMEQLTKSASVENWQTVIAELGLNEELSNTRLWKRPLFRSAKRNDMLCLWFDRRKQLMDKPDAKRTAEVMLLKISVVDESSEHYDPSYEGIYLAFQGVQRNVILNPQRRSDEDKGFMAGALLKITFHVLQRIIQRGHGLADDGQISYYQLLNYLSFVWLTAEYQRVEHREFPVDLTVEYEGSRFIVHSPDKRAPMTLITLLPKKK
jgi:hypothetical protein